MAPSASPTEDEEGEEIPSIKDLASSVPRLRRVALTEITAHLSRRSKALTRTQCLQLWRGFFIALYMHDSKSPVSVQNLISELAGLFTILAEKDRLGGGDEDAKKSGRKVMARQEEEGVRQTVMFADAFWETMAREWSGVDVHRMNKILLLIRVVTRKIFEICLLDPQDGGGTVDMRAVETEEQCEIFERWPLSPRERKVPDGLRYHVLDVWVDELRLASGEVGEEEVEEVRRTVKNLMVPVQKLAKEGLAKPVRVRAKETLAAAEEIFPDQGEGEKS